MRNIKISAALAAVALATAPLAAQADFSRAMAPTVEGSELSNEDSTTRVLALAGVAAVIIGLLVITDSDDPVSG